MDLNDNRSASDPMKTLNFVPELAALIKQGKKTTTFRLFDEKNLQAGDIITLTTRDGKKVNAFAKQKLISFIVRLSQP